MSLSERELGRLKALEFLTLLVFLRLPLGDRRFIDKIMREFSESMEVISPEQAHGYKALAEQLEKMSPEKE